MNELCRKYGMSDASYYNWKAHYAGFTVNELKRLKALEEENRRLRHDEGGYGCLILITMKVFNKVKVE